MPDNRKPIAWIGSSKKDLIGLPTEVCKFSAMRLTLPNVATSTMRPRCSKDLVALVFWS